MRGDKGRFQLFGDTVNTTARIETSGERNKIHCSNETAELLKSAGHGNWLIPREEKIHAKGKGYLKTYFVRVFVGSDINTSTNRSESNDDSATVSDTNDDSGSHEWDGGGDAWMTNSFYLFSLYSLKYVRMYV